MVTIAGGPLKRKVKWPSRWAWVRMGLSNR